MLNTKIQGNQGASEAMAGQTLTTQHDVDVNHYAKVDANKKHQIHIPVQTVHSTINDAVCLNRKEGEQLTNLVEITLASVCVSQQQAPVQLGKLTKTQKKNLKKRQKIKEFKQQIIYSELKVSTLNIILAETLIEQLPPSFIYQLQSILVSSTVIENYNPETHSIINLWTLGEKLYRQNREQVDSAIEGNFELYDIDHNMDCVDIFYKIFIPDTLTFKGSYKNFIQYAKSKNQQLVYGFQQTRAKQQQAGIGIDKVIQLAYQNNIPITYVFDCKYLAVVPNVLQILINPGIGYGHVMLLRPLKYIKIPQQKILPIQLMTLRYSYQLQDIDEVMSQTQFMEDLVQAYGENEIKILIESWKLHIRQRYGAALVGGKKGKNKKSLKPFMTYDEFYLKLQSYSVSTIPNMSIKFIQNHQSVHVQEKTMGLDHYIRVYNPKTDAYCTLYLVCQQHGIDLEYNFRNIVINGTDTYDELIAYIQVLMKDNDSIERVANRQNLNTITEINQWKIQYQNVMTQYIQALANAKTTKGVQIKVFTDLLTLFNTVAILDIGVPRQQINIQKFGYVFLTKDHVFYPIEVPKPHTPITQFCIVQAIKDYYTHSQVVMPHTTTELEQRVNDIRVVMNLDNSPQTCIDEAVILIKYYQIPANILLTNQKIPDVYMPTKNQIFVITHTGNHVSGHFTYDKVIDFYITTNALANIKQPQIYKPIKSFHQSLPSTTPATPLANPTTLIDTTYLDLIQTILQVKQNSQIFLESNLKNILYIMEINQDKYNIIYEFLNTGIYKFSETQTYNKVNPVVYNNAIEFIIQQNQNKKLKKEYYIHFAYKKSSQQLSYHAFDNQVYITSGIRDQIQIGTTVVYQEHINYRYGNIPYRLGIENFNPLCILNDGEQTQILISEQCADSQFYDSTFKIREFTRKYYTKNPNAIVNNELKSNTQIQQICSLYHIDHPEIHTDYIQEIMQDEYTNIKHVYKQMNLQQWEDYCYKIQEREYFKTGYKDAIRIYSWKYLKKYNPIKATHLYVIPMALSLYSFMLGFLFVIACSFWYYKQDLKRIKKKTSKRIMVNQQMLTETNQSSIKDYLYRYFKYRGIFKYLQNKSDNVVKQRYEFTGLRLRQIVQTFVITWGIMFMIYFVYVSCIIPSIGTGLLYVIASEQRAQCINNRMIINVQQSNRGGKIAYSFINQKQEDFYCETIIKNDDDHKKLLEVSGQIMDADKLARMKFLYIYQQYYKKPTIDIIQIYQQQDIELEVIQFYEKVRQTDPTYRQQNDVYRNYEQGHKTQSEQEWDETTGDILNQQFIDYLQSSAKQFQQHPYIGWIAKRIVQNIQETYKLLRQGVKSGNWKHLEAHTDQIAGKHTWAISQILRIYISVAAKIPMYTDYTTSQEINEIILGTAGIQQMTTTFWVLAIFPETVILTLPKHQEYFIFQIIMFIILAWFGYWMMSEKCYK